MTLIDRFTSSFDHDKYEDEYRERLLAVVKRKQRGEEVHAPPEEELEAPPDLFEALRASVETARGSKTNTASPPLRWHAAHRGLLCCG
jgi:DNA end-binding protein Ku